MESPRSSKRRKLDSPKHIAPESPVTATLLGRSARNQKVRKLPLSAERVRPEENGEHKKISPVINDEDDGLTLSSRPSRAKKVPKRYEESSPMNDITPFPPHETSNILRSKSHIGSNTDDANSKQVVNGTKNVQGDYEPGKARKRPLPKAASSDAYSLTPIKVRGSKRNRKNGAQPSSVKNSTKATVDGVKESLLLSEPLGTGLQSQDNREDKEAAKHLHNSARKDAKKRSEAPVSMRTGSRSATASGRDVTAQVQEHVMPEEHKSTPRKPRAKGLESSGELALTPSKKLTPTQPASVRKITLVTNDKEDGKSVKPVTSRKRSSLTGKFRSVQRASRASQRASLANSHGLEDEEEENGDGDVGMAEAPSNILDPDEPKRATAMPLPPTNGDMGAVNNIAEVYTPQRIEVVDEQIQMLKQIVLNKLNRQRQCPLVGLDKEYEKVHQLIENTVTAGEGNSMLLIGPRGTGKSALVNAAISEVSKEHQDHFHVIRLNGFIHTDDKVALREIWRQLGREMEIEEESGGAGSTNKNYADILTTLLALLSHPAELAASTGRGAADGDDRVAHAVIFVMDEFDLFASHPRQTLLYNLFDIAQSRKAPVAVLGLTTRINVTDSLEKRVKSRFSHRYVHVSVAKSFTAFQEICKAMLQVKDEELSDEERATFRPTKKANSASSKKAKSTEAAEGKVDQEGTVLSSWNSCIEALFSIPSFLTTFLSPHYHRTKAITDALTQFLLPIANLTVDSFPLHPSSFLPSTHNSTSNQPSLHLRLHPLPPPDSLLPLLPPLSDLSLALLIAAARLDIILDADTCNFNMAYAEYVSLASRARVASAASGSLATGGPGGRVWHREVARREWEALGRAGLVVPAVGNFGGGGGGGGAGGAGGAGQGWASQMVRCDVALEEIPGSVPGMDRVLERWCKQI